MEADCIFRVAFGTFLGLPNPIEFFGDADKRTDSLGSGSLGGLAH